MMANNNTAIIIIGMVLIVALVMYGPVTEGFGNFLGDAWDKWGDIFGTQASKTGISLALYKDGQLVKELPATNPIPTLSIPPDPSGEWDTLYADYIVQLTYEGTLSQWSMDANIQRYILKDGIEYYRWSQQEASRSGTSWTSGTITTWSAIPPSNALFSMQELTKAQLETIMQNVDAPSGTYNLWFASRIWMTCTFEGDKSDSKIADTQSGFTFQWDEPQGTITGLTLQVQSVPLGIFSP